MKLYDVTYTVPDSKIWMGMNVEAVNPTHAKSLVRNFEREHCGRMVKEFKEIREISPDEVAGA